MPREFTISGVTPAMSVCILCSGKAHSTREVHMGAKAVVYATFHPEPLKSFRARLPTLKPRETHCGRRFFTSSDSHRPNPCPRVLSYPRAQSV